MKISRRASLALLTAASGIGLSSLGVTKPTGSPSLATLAQAKGMRFGSAVSAGDRGLRDPAVAELLLRECRIIAPETELKMHMIHTQPDRYDFAPGDRLLAFCDSHQLALRGHNLLWARDEFIPAWLKRYDFGSAPKVEAERLLREYIAKVAGHYGERLTSWDVVNEAIDEKTGELRSNVFTRVLGRDALRIAFEATREHLPAMQLVYNDYMSWEASSDAHRHGVLELLRWFREQQVPVDALGVQSHINAGFDFSSTQLARWKAFLDETTRMGYDLLITEFDVSDQAIVSGSIDVRDARVAEVGRVFLDQLLGYRQLKDVLVWGICDKYSWLQTYSPRKDGLRQRPTLYDDDFQPKLLREVLAAAFKAAPQR